MQRRTMTIGLAAAAAALGAAVAARRLAPSDPAAGAEQALWSQQWERPEGGIVAAATLRGRPLLLNFWATWCPPCVEELPLLDRFYRERRAEGWQVLALAIDQPSAVRQFLQRQPLSFPVGLAGLGGTDLGRQLGNDTGALPFTVVFDRAGRIAHRKLGQVKPQDLQAWAQAA
ncbi:MAG: TlpA disulfide reductase family protein [Tepidimonas sp.]|uniref:TlpA disulfide reductase family protein n=1 Tax=Tepidimonas sp. TaxID=2002775 RepID=UPI00259ED6F4|nr:TlpA disulfide reductase family protein [Tepidimonas sp.]MDM7457498.1 TlpA disulfide reductase family protein [Tepidimonas sp.]